MPPAGCFRTRSPSQRAAADPCLWSHGYRDRLWWNAVLKLILSVAVESNGLFVSVEHSQRISPQILTIWTEPPSAYYITERSCNPIFLLMMIGCVSDILSRSSSSSPTRHLPSSAFHLDFVKDMIGEVSYPVVPSFVRLHFPHTGSRPVEWKDIMSVTPFCQHTSGVQMLSFMAVLILHFPLISLVFSAFLLLY